MTKTTTPFAPFWWRRCWRLNSFKIIKRRSKGKKKRNLSATHSIPLSTTASVTAALCCSPWQCKVTISRWKLKTHFYSDQLYLKKNLRCVVWVCWHPYPWQSILSTDMEISKAMRNILLPFLTPHFLLSLASEAHRAILFPWKTYLWGWCPFTITPPPPPPYLDSVIVSLFVSLYLIWKIVTDSYRQLQTVTDSDK